MKEISCRKCKCGEELDLTFHSFLCPICWYKEFVGLRKEIIEDPEWFPI